MNEKQHDEAAASVNRREFIKGGSIGSLMMMLGAVELRGQSAEESATEYDTTPDPVKTGLIGCGLWGREVLENLARVPFAPVAALCDSYGPYLRRAARSVPEAQTYEDYRQLLDQKDVQAVIVATPTHLHREIVEAALAAGKHVYCEAPIAHTIEDARAIAQAARAHPHLNFQSGLQGRSDPQLHYVLEFVRTAAVGRMVGGKGQWHRKHSWRRASPNAEFERALNWRLQKDISPGLIGEIGIHQIDLNNWYLQGLPEAVSGYGSLILWNDGRNVPDTVDAVLEYPNGVRFRTDLTLANSFDGDFSMFYGTFGTIMIRERRAWMFKEVDSPLLGWEVYARKEDFHKETGIVLGANATKLAAQGEDAALDASGLGEKGALFYALEAFATNCNIVANGVEDFSLLFDESDKEGLRDYLKSLKSSLAPAAGWEQGYEATVSALKAHEAVMGRERVTLNEELFQVS